MVEDEQTRYGVPLTRPRFFLPDGFDRGSKSIQPVTPTIKKPINIKTIFSGRIWANRYDVPLNRPWSF